jgi:hypothetical protein
VQHSLSAVDRLTSTELADAEQGLDPTCDGLNARNRHTAIHTYLKQLMDKNAGFIHHSNI